MSELVKFLLGACADPNMPSYASGLVPSGSVLIAHCLPTQCLRGRDSRLLPTTKPVWNGAQSRGSTSSWMPASMLA